MGSYFFREFRMETTTQRREQIERLIEAAELEVQQHPRRYNVKVAMLALLGYTVIFGMLFILISIVGGIGWAALASTSLLILLVKKKIIFVILAMIYVLVRALWVKFEKPTGYELKAKNYPALFAELKSLSQQLGAPAIHQVILTPEYNAGILQLPRLGIFGWHKNTLFLGLELLMSMTPEQARSVIAHELGHLSGKHSRFSGWIYRVRLSWQRIMDGLDQQDNFGADLMRRFFDWYAPTFAAYSFALARANEYSADEVAAKLTSKDDMAHALVNTYVVHDLLGEYYWQPFFKQADESAQPTTSPYRQLMAFLRQHRFEASELEYQIGRAMAHKTDHYDTHPALRDRLKALQCQVISPEPVSQSAALRWLDKQLPAIIKDFDQNWLERNKSKWNERYQHVKQGRNKLANLKTKTIQTLTSEELWELASLTEEFAPDEDCLPLFELYSKKRPDDADAYFVMGRLLLTRINEDGVEKMKQAIDKQPHLKIRACDWIIYFYRQMDNANAIKFWQQQAERQIDINRAADKERDVITKSDQFTKPERQSDFNDLFTKRIMNIKGIKHAWLAEKRMRYYPESKTYVLVYEKGFFEKEAKLTELIVSQLHTNSTCFVIQKQGEYSALAKEIIKKGVELF
jgi:Zn-dependent protease with chaperone function